MQQQQLSPAMQALKDHDPEFFAILNPALAKAREPGSLDAKTKTLITLALDAAGGHRDGVKALAARARNQGATDKEISEVIRLAFLVGGYPGLLSGLAAFEK